MADVSKTITSATGTLPGPVGEQFVQQPLPGAGAAQTVQGLALADFGEGDHSFTNDQLLVGSSFLKSSSSLLATAVIGENYIVAGEESRGYELLPQCVSHGR
jgi:hypothetical protein